MLKLSRYALLLCAFVPALQAQSILPKGNVFLGYSYNHFGSNGSYDNLNGWELAGEGRVLPFLGIAGEYSNYYGSGSLHEQNFLFGPRASVHLDRFTPFAQLLIGGAHVSANPLSNTSFATSVGGGVDWSLRGPLAWRTQLDYLHTSFFGAAQNNTRITTGIVLRF